MDRQEGFVRFIQIMMIETVKLTLIGCLMRLSNRLSYKPSLDLLSTNYHIIVSASFLPRSFSQSKEAKATGAYCPDKVKRRGKTAS